MSPIIQKSNFTKWLAFAFPYLAQLFHELICNISLNVFNMPIDEHTQQTLYLLINSFSLLFGFKLLSNYTHKENFKNYQPKNYTH